MSAMKQAVSMRPLQAGCALPVKPFLTARRTACAPRVQAVQGSNGLQEQAVKAVALSTFATSFLTAGNACAANEIASMAAGDNRFGAIALLFAPVVGWVLFNIGGPALNQLNETAAKNRPVKAKPRGVKRSVAAGLGLTAASLLAAQSADAATEVTQLAAGDGRFGAIALLFAPVVGWVLFNIGGPALNQFSETAAKNRPLKVKPRGAKRSVAAGLGLTAASMLAAQGADAAELAAKTSDGRFGIIATLFLPVVGWVAFNIYEGAKNQFDQMQLK